MPKPSPSPPSRSSSIPPSLPPQTDCLLASMPSASKTAAIKNPGFKIKTRFPVMLPLALGFSLIVMHDATGVRRHAVTQDELPRPSHISLQHIHTIPPLSKLVVMREGPGFIRLYSCYKCGCHVALHDDIVSKDFQAGNWRAYLFSHATNIRLGPKEDRQLMTGLHTVSDVFCSDCGENLGWKYEKAFEATQKYKEGKVVLEKYKILMDSL